MLGAGASAETLPLNNDLLLKIKELINVGKNKINEMHNASYMSHIVETFEPIIQEAINEKSLDTLAKSYQDNDDKLNQIKILIWIYFSSVAGLNKLDKRYKNLLLKIGEKTKNGYKLNKAISFINWNYDLQLEETISFLDNITMHEAGSKHLAYPAYDLLNSDSSSRDRSPDLYRIIHLNGCAGFYRKYPDRSISHTSAYDLTKSIDYNSFIELVINHFYTNNHRSDSNTSISFAFENSAFTQKAIDFSKKIASITTHLVIIGYSLPDFNTAIDRQIFDQMKNLEYIFIQNPELEKIKNDLLDMSDVINQRYKNGNLQINKESYGLNEFHVPKRFLF
jgi:hypothetical protein